VAVIDLGSNSWRLVVYMFVPADWWKLTDEIYETVRIGAGLAETGRLGDAAMGRGLETLAVFERFLAAHGLGPDAVHAVATSAIRDAANGEMFLKAARAASGLNIEVISDEDEAARWRMHGSPTLLIDGVDPFAELGQPPGMSCRLYRDDEGRTSGAPSVGQLRHAIEQALAAGAGPGDPGW